MLHTILRLQQYAYYFQDLYACAARRKGKQCGFDTQTKIKGLWLFCLVQRLLADKTKSQSPFS